ncbi:MAG TPA: sulfotransferase domain-containing protein [Thermoanaerobaculia bacterium]|nr:sulfotransferase domain-containing protein [Thermoanaerobaculia bacterium]
MVAPRPNFFLVGDPRSGTSAMYSLLKQHPEIYLSILKEPHFFGTDLTVQPHTIREPDLYLGMFADAGDYRRVGEGSVWYLTSKRAAQEIREFAPDAKILALLREPSEMAHSLYHLYRRTGNEDLPTFEEALAAEEERREGRRFPPGCYFPEGLLYTDVARAADKVERYFTAFGRDRVRVVLFEDFRRDNAKVYREVLEFLEVDPTFEPELDPARAAERIQVMAIRQLRRTDPRVRSKIGREGLRQHAGSREPLAPAVRSALRETFRSDVTRLGELLGRDLSHWSR